MTIGNHLRQFQGLLGEGQTNSVLFGILLGFCVVKIKSSDTFRLRIVDFYNVFRLVEPTYPWKVLYNRHVWPFKFRLSVFFC